MVVLAEPLSQSHTPTPDVHYPESDGNPIADNTLQFRYITMIHNGLEALFATELDVFVAGDLLWYPVRNHAEIRQAPDILVVFGRPKGDRGSYRQWAEGNIAPQVVFEIISPGNRANEMARKFDFYDRYGVEEYYYYDPERGDFTVWVRQEERLRPAEFEGEWTSPRLRTRLRLEADGSLAIFRPDGERFKNYTDLMTERNEIAAERDAQRERAERLVARLRELGLDPDTL